jgi:hypothetical protein
MQGFCGIAHPLQTPPEESAVTVCLIYHVPLLQLAICLIPTANSSSSTQCTQRPMYFLTSGSKCLIVCFGKRSTIVRGSVRSHIDSSIIAASSSRFPAAGRGVHLCILSRNCCSTLGPRARARSARHAQCDPEEGDRSAYVAKSHASLSTKTQC